MTQEPQLQLGAKLDALQSARRELAALRAQRNAAAEEQHRMQEVRLCFCVVVCVVLCFTVCWR
jgi:hypothetical protein